MAERMFLFSLASILHSFDWKLLEGEKLDLSEKFGIVLKKRVPLMTIPNFQFFNKAVFWARFVSILTLFPDKLAKSFLSFFSMAVTETCRINT
ncbi:hypothetical protein ACSBR2_040960 [Camellia fascicularis]